MTEPTESDTRAYHNIIFAGLLRWRNAEAKAAEARGEKMFMGKPDAWYEDLYWFCANGHVSGRFLKSEERGDCCLACGELVCMGPPIGERAFAPILAAIAQGLAETAQQAQGEARQPGPPQGDAP